MITFLVSVVIAGIALLVLISYVSQNTKTVDKTATMESWNVVLHKAQSEATWESAIVHADKLLDSVLKTRGYKGTTMGERLISAKKVLSNRNSVWEAHKLRNRLVHEEHVNLNSSKVFDALRGFETALKDLEAI